MTIVHDKEVETVSKFLGSVFDNKLKWDLNTDAILKKGQLRLYFLRKFCSFLVDRQILSYNESVISFSFICWFQNLTKRKKKIHMTELCHLVLKNTLVKKGGRRLQHTMLFVVYV